MIAYVLYSGGLDSVIAIKLLQEQNIKVVAVHFTSPFFENEKFCEETAKEQGFRLIVKKLDRKYLNMIKNPLHGYGSAINPCLDCHMHMLNEIKKIAKGGMIITGEVMRQRPFSQKSGDLQLIEKESKLKNKILRPLSAKLLPETIYEKKGIVKREKLLGISGRGRKIQLEFAKKHKLKHLAPAGGCLLADQEFAKKLTDLFKHKKIISDSDLTLLKFGRHFRLSENKIIVGRNENENNKITELKNKGDFIFEVEGMGPTTLLRGKKTKESIKLAAELTLSYSNENDVVVNYGKKQENKIRVKKIKRVELECFKV